MTAATRLRCLGAGLALLLGAVPALAAPGNRPDLFLTWNAPYGQPGAKSEVDRACADTTGSDTLYLSFRLRAGEGVFSGMTGIVLFHAQFTDSLGPPWNTTDFKPGFLKVEFATDTGGVFNSGWESRGFGDWRYYPEPARGIIRLIYAVPAMSATPVPAGRVFCFARVIMRRGPGSGCDGALCVEWMESKFAFSINDRDAEGRQGRPSFVTANSPAGIACAKYRLIADRREVEREERLKPKPKP